MGTTDKYPHLIPIWTKRLICIYLKTRKIVIKVKNIDLTSAVPLIWLLTVHVWQEWLSHEWCHQRIFRERRTNAWRHLGVLEMHCENLSYDSSLILWLKNQLVIHIQSMQYCLFVYIKVGLVLQSVPKLYQC